MNKLDFDAKKVIKVDIGRIEANPWNPKEKDTDEFRKIVKSIVANGLKGFILVRELNNGQLQVIDGEQRYTAAVELGYDEMYVYNEGKMDDKTAMELTIWYQQQVPFDKIKEAKLVAELLVTYNDEEHLPYNPEELNDLKMLADFNMDDYNDKPEKEKDHNTLSFKLTQEEFKLAYDFFNRADQSREEVLMDLINDNL